MKRVNNLFNKIVEWDNIVTAEATARKGKAKAYGVKIFDKKSYNSS